MMPTGYDLLLEQTGHYGLYQKRNLLYMYVAPIVMYMPRAAWIFLAAVPLHRCQLPWEDTNANYSLPDSVLNTSVPWDSKNQQWSQCTMFNTDESGGVTEVQCTHYIYDNSVYASSAVIEWNLVCDRAWMRATAQAVFEAGIFCGATITGLLSDRFGRKPTLCGAIAVTTVAGVLAGVMPEFYSFIIFRFIIACASIGTTSVFVLGMELLGPTKRMFASVVFNCAFSFGFLLLAVYAYGVKEWRWLQIVISLSCIVLAPYWWVLPESNRWLISKGRFAQAKKNILQTARVNKRQIEPEYVDKVLRETRTNESSIKPKDKKLIDVLRHPQLRFIAIYICCIWYACNAVYWGLSFNVSNLGGNLFLNFLISVAVEFPGYTSLILFDKYMGRRVSLCGLLLVTGLTLLGSAVVPSDMAWLTIALAMAGKMTVSAAYALIYTYTPEVYPTVVRNVGVGVSSTAARIGGITAPYIILLSDSWKPLPMVIYGGIAVLSGFLCLLLPETRGKSLPDTLEDMDFQKKKTVQKTDVSIALLGVPKSESL